MKIVAVGFTTALLVFAIASAMSEMLLTRDPEHAGDRATRRRNVVDGSEPSRSTRVMPRLRNANAATQEPAEQPTTEMQQTLREIRQHESGIQAKQDALRIVFDEIREEQKSADLIRRRLTEEIAELREAVAQVAERKATVSPEEPTVIADSRIRGSRISARPIVSVHDSQAVRDTAVLVNRLARQGSLREAISLLRRLKDRDAAKVLSELSATDSQLALRLSEDLLTARDEESNRR